MTKVTIDMVLCKGCNICISHCPKKVFASSQKRSKYGTPMPEPANENECIACRICEKMCPDAAINVEDSNR